MCSLPKSNALRLALARQSIAISCPHRLPIKSPYVRAGELLTPMMWGNLTRQINGRPPDVVGPRVLSFVPGGVSKTDETVEPPLTPLFRKMLVAAHDAVIRKRFPERHSEATP